MHITYFELFLDKDCWTRIIDVGDAIRTYDGLKKGALGSLVGLLSDDHAHTLREDRQA